MKLDLGEFRRLAGIEGGHGLQLEEEDTSVLQTRNPTHLIEYELGLRKAPPKPKKKVQKKTKPKRPPTYKELYRENRSLKRQNHSLREENEGLVGQVRELTERVQGAARGFQEANPMNPWEMQGSGARYANTRVGRGLSEFLDYTGEELTSRSAPRNSRQRRRPPTPSPDATFTSPEVRPETMAPRLSLFPSFEEEAPAPAPSSSEREVTRWETLDVGEGRETTSDLPIAPSRRFASCIEEADPVPKGPAPEPAPNPRFEGILTEQRDPRRT